MLLVRRWCSVTSAILREALSRATDTVDAVTEVADLLALAAPVVDGDDLALVRRLLDGQSTEQIAAACGVSGRVIRRAWTRVSHPSTTPLTTSAPKPQVRLSSWTTINR